MLGKKILPTDPTQKNMVGKRQTMFYICWSTTKRFDINVCNACVFLLYKNNSYEHCLIVY